MLIPPDKEIVLDASGGIPSSSLAEAAKIGIRRVILRNGATLAPQAAGLSVVLVSDQPGENRATWVKVEDGTDINRAILASRLDQSFVVVECSDWKVIPLENLIAEFRRRGRRLYAFADGIEEIETAFGALEKGVDGVVIPPSSLDDVMVLDSNPGQRFDLELARITRIVEAGMGDRVCVDTTSELNTGEGMLVGSRANFFFLLHGETLETKYIPPRPFRVNAGALHQYVLQSNGKTKYLSELQAPDEITLVDSKGNHRDACVGRVKLERRPMIFVEASTGEAVGSVIIQKAETIRLVSSEGVPLSVMELRPGDSVLVHRNPTAGRHFGGEVDERVTER